MRYLVALSVLASALGCSREMPSVGPIPLKDVIRGLDDYGHGPGPKGIVIHIHAASDEQILHCTWPDGDHPNLRIAVEPVDAGDDPMARAKASLRAHFDLLAEGTRQGRLLSMWQAYPDGTSSRRESIGFFEPVFDLAPLCVERDRVALSVALETRPGFAHVVLFRREATGWRAVWDQDLLEGLSG